MVSEKNSPLGLSPPSKARPSRSSRVQFRPVSSCLAFPLAYKNLAHQDIYRRSFFTLGLVQCPLVLSCHVPNDFVQYHLLVQSSCHIGACPDACLAFPTSSAVCSSQNDPRIRCPNSNFEIFNLNRNFAYTFDMFNILFCNQVYE